MSHLGIRFIDFGVYDDGDIYESDVNIPIGYVAKQECHSHHIGIRVRYTSAVIPGSGEAFQLIRATLRATIDSVDYYTYLAFIDKVEATDHIAVRIKHSGSEFHINHITLEGKMRRKQVRE